MYVCMYAGVAVKEVSKKCKQSIYKSEASRVSKIKVSVASGTNRSIVGIKYCLCFKLCC